jgi:hypothetical protein
MTRRVVMILITERARLIFEKKPKNVKRPINEKGGSSKILIKWGGKGTKVATETNWRRKTYKDQTIPIHHVYERPSIIIHVCWRVRRVALFPLGRHTGTTRELDVGHDHDLCC